MARIVLISPYLKGGKNAAKLAQRTRYVATRPGVELLVDERSTLPATKKQQDFITRLLKSFPSCWELIEYEEYLDHPTQGSASAFIQQVQEDYMEALEQKENFIDYISHRPGVQKDGEHGLWDAHGKVQNLAQAVREVAEHTGNVWTPVVVLRREDAERLGYDSAENWQALVNASICDIAKAYKIRPENLRWYAAFHQKPNQVHIHMIIFSADPKEGYLTKEGIRQVKSAFARRIYYADRMHIYQQKDTARQELQTQTRKAMLECIARLSSGAVENPRLEQLTEELAERLLTVKGRKVYGYLPPRVKAIVDTIVEELAKDERVSAAYETWQTLYEQVCLDYDQRPPKRLPLSRQKEFRSVRNMVIQETLQWMVERQQCADAQRTSGMLTESLSSENSAAAKESHVIDTNPTIYLEAKGGGVPQEERQALTDEQVERLLDAIRGLPPYVFVMIGLYAGLRREEILALQWDSVYLDTEAPYLTVRRAWHTEHNRPVILTELKTKAAERNIPLPDRLAECLKEAKKKSTSDYVIANQDGEPLSYTQFKRLWQYIVTRTAKPRIARKLVDGKYVKYMLYPKLGEKARNNGHVVYSLDFEVTPHMLRHTYITNLIHASVDPKTVQYLAGHESNKITMDIYAKVKYNKPEQLAGVLSGAFAEWDGGEYEAAQ